MDAVISRARLLDRTAGIMFLARLLAVTEGITLRILFLVSTDDTRSRVVRLKKNVEINLGSTASCG